MKLTLTGKLISMVAGSCLCAAASANTWLPTDGDVNTFDASGFLPGFGSATFAIFDAGAGLDSADHLVLAPNDRVVFADNGGSWTATNLAGDMLDLGSSAAFQFAAKGTDFAGPDSMSSAGANTNSWALTFGKLESVLGVVDANPSEVPVPAAVWLFGSGLVGLIGVARRKRG